MRRTVCRNRVCLVGVFAVGAILASRGAAQNVTGYESIPNPYLLLLREPAVHADLSLAPGQREELQRVNDEVDGPLLALRNWPAEKADAKLAELTEQTRAGLSGVLDVGQRGRLAQITLRVRGIQAVLDPKVVEALKLTAQQQEAIRAAFAQARDEIDALAKQFDGGTPRSQLERQASLARERGERRVLSRLTDGQKRQLAQMLGREFDESGLGRAKFKAPELVDSGVWINSGPLRLADLRGQVVAIHFWAFGCVNCQRNYPWYRDWHDAYAGRGLKIVGIHTPETDAERNLESLRKRVAEAGFRFPVLADNDKQNWNTWGNSMWPSVYLIDKSGYLRYWWYGELDWQGAGGQKIMARRIEELMAEKS